MANEQAKLPEGTAHDSPTIEPKGAVVAESKLGKAPQHVEPRRLPPYKVLLHNDDVNTMAQVIVAIVKLTAMTLADAEDRMFEAQNKGVSLLLVTHKERAELYEEQFRSQNLIVTIEPDE